MIEQKRNNIKGSLILGTAALIWGLAFVAQSDAADKVPPFLFNSLRSLIAAIFLFCALLVRKLTTKQNILPSEPINRRRVVTGGILCGILLTVSVNLQQAAITIYPAGAAAEARGGFLTALYVVFVPIIALFMGKKLELPILGAIVIATGGFYMLCLWGGIESIYLADLLVLLCAVSFSFHILSVDHYSGFMNGMLLSMVQFLICGILSGVISLAVENAVVWENLLSAAFPILYTYLVKPGILSLNRLVELLCVNPRKRFGLPLGNDYSVWDLEAEYTVDPAEFLSMGKATPFEGWKVCGRCMATVCDGKTVYTTL